jgi:hypothetical protein
VLAIDHSQVIHELAERMCIAIQSVLGKRAKRFS